MAKVIEAKAIGATIHGVSRGDKIIPDTLTVAFDNGETVEYEWPTQKEADVEYERDSAALDPNAVDVVDKGDWFIAYIPVRNGFCSVNLLKEVEA